MLCHLHVNTLLKKIGFWFSSYTKPLGSRHIKEISNSATMKSWHCAMEVQRNKQK